MPSGYIGPMAPMWAPASLRPESKRGPSLWLRIRVALKRLELDSALAEGADPRTTEALALRAEQLADSSSRTRVATGIENLFRMATIGPGPEATTSLVRAPFDRYRVAANRPELEELAGRVRQARPQNVRGLAMASVLLEDPRSPLYAHTPSDQLKPAIQAASSALDR
jgi:hypothetical protein